MQPACPDQERLRQLLNETLPAEEQQALQAHLEQCTKCQRTLESLAAGKDSWSNAAEHLGKAEPGASEEPALRKVVAELAGQPTSAESSGPSPADAKADDLSFLGPSTQPGSLGRLDHYEILAVLGRGGFGVVLKAQDDVLDRIVAIKVLKPALANGTARMRFKREAKAAAAISHDHVVGIHAVAETNGVSYIVMQLVAGVSLQQRLDDAGPPELKEILRIGMQTTAGLAAAHAQGLVHRDIKPANILLENGIERVKITDFGLARAIDDASVTQSGVIAGTPMYMAPEQAAGETVDLRADLFSLGSVLYTMCTGRPPFRATGTMAVLKRVIDDTPRPIQEINPDIPDWLCDIIAKLHAKKPQERFQSAQEVAELLGRHLSLLQQPGSTPVHREARGITFSGQPALPHRNARIIILGVAVAFVFAIMCGIGFQSSWEIALLEGAMAGLAVGAFVKWALSLSGHAATARSRIMLGSVPVGLLFGVISGIGIHSSGESPANQPGVHHEVIEVVFASELALIGFVCGALVGGGIGALWNRRPLAHAVACVLITFVGGLAGTALAGLFGAATTRTTVRDGFIRVDHGVSDEFVTGGAIAGLALGAFGAWALSRMPTWLGLSFVPVPPARYSEARKSRNAVGYVLLGSIALLLLLLPFLILLLPSRVATTVEVRSHPPTIAGTWASDWGQVTLMHGPIENNRPVVVNGFYMMGDTKANITRGTFDPGDGAFEFLFSEPENKVTGSAKLQLTANGNRLEGAWSNSAGESGIWTMMRVTQGELLLPQVHP